MILRSGLRLIHNLSILYGMCVIQQDETVLFSVSISFIQDFNLLHDHCLPVRNHSPGVKVVPQELTSLILVRFDDSMHSHLLIFFLSLCRQSQIPLQQNRGPLNFQQRWQTQTEEQAMFKISKLFVS